MEPKTYHDQSEAIIEASQLEVFDYLDDQTRLAAHMERRSMMMLGGRMTYEFDAARGRAVGSVIRMEGRFLGIRLSVEEVVTQRDPPVRKVWETRGVPHLLILGGYRMGFEISPDEERTKLRVFIEYNPPESVFGRAMAFLFAGIYARWCVRRMADDAKSHFM